MFPPAAGSGGGQVTATAILRELRSRSQNPPVRGAAYRAGVKKRTFSSLIHLEAQMEAPTTLTFGPARHS